MPVKRGSAKGKIRTRFWPGTKAGENVPGGPVCPRVHRTINRRWRCRTARCASMPPGAAGPSSCKFARSTPARYGAEAREKLLEAARRREIDVRAGLAPGSLGPVGDGSAGHSSGTGASRCRIRFADRGSGPDHAGRSSDGGNARRIRRFRKRDFAGTNTGWHGPCAAERQATGPAGNRGRTRCEKSGNYIAPAISKSEIARRLQIGRTSVRRILGNKS